MLTTACWSGNSKRCGTRASLSFGPMSGSVLMSVNTLSITSRNSSAERKAGIERESNAALVLALRLRAHCFLDLPDRLPLGVAHALAAQPEESLPVRLGDALGEVHDEAAVRLGLVGCGLALHERDRCTDLLQHVLLELLLGGVAIHVHRGLRGSDLIEQLALT